MFWKLSILPLNDFKVILRQTLEEFVAAKRKPFMTFEDYKRSPLKEPENGQGVSNNCRQVSRDLGPFGPCTTSIHGEV